VIVPRKKKIGTSEWEKGRPERSEECTGAEEGSAGSVPQPLTFQDRENVFKNNLA